MLAKIRKHPWKLFGAVLIALVIMSFPDVHSQNEFNWLKISIYIIVVIISALIFFNISVNEEELNQSINEEIKRLGYSKEELFHKTKYSRYEITPSESGGYSFAINKEEKKKLLKELQSRSS